MNAVGGWDSTAASGWKICRYSPPVSLLFSLSRQPRRRTGGVFLPTDRGFLRRRSSGFRMWLDAQRKLLRYARATIGWSGAG